MRRRSSPHFPGSKRQQGFVLLLMLVLVTMGILFTVVSQVSVVGMKWARAGGGNAAMLQAKEALIGYAATYRDNNSAEVFGYLPCPDTSGDGTAIGTCGNAGETAVGLLPYKTLGLPDLRDSNGVCLWYVVSGSFKNNPKGTAAATSVPLNWDTQGQIKVVDASGSTIAAPGDANGGAAAVIIAAGAPISGQNRTSSSSTVCGSVPTEVTAYIESTITAAGTTTLTQGQIDSASNNDQILSITPKEIFSRVIARADFKNLATAVTPGQINSLSAAIKTSLESQILTILKSSTGSAPPTGIAAPDTSGGYTTLSNGNLVGDLSITSLTGTYASYFDNWRNQYRYVVCGDLGNGCLNIAGTTCRAALMFGGQSTTGGPRTSVVSSSSTLGNFFEGTSSSPADSNGALDILNGNSTTFSSAGNTSYLSPNTSTSSDVTTCIFPGDFVSFSRDISSFASGTAASGSSIVSVNTSSKSITLGSTGGSSSTGCAWLTRALPMASSMRLYFRINFGAKGDGFALALADGATNLGPADTSRTQIMCGASGSAQLGYAGTPPSGTSAGIKIPKVGIEFDTRYDSGSNDPQADHMAFLYWGDATDSSSAGSGDDDNTHYLGNGGFAVTAASWSGGTVTITTASPHGYSVGQKVVVSGLTPSAYNGTYSVLGSGLTTTQFQISLTSNPGTFTSAGMVKAISTGSAPRNPRVATAIRTSTVKSFSWSSATGGRATITTSSNHNLSVNQQVYITGVSPAGYNGVYTVTSVPSSTRFRYTLASNPHGTCSTSCSGTVVQGTEISGLTWSSNTATATITKARLPSTAFTMSGITPSGFDTSQTITPSNSATTLSSSFTYPLSSDPGGTFSTENPAGMFVLRSSSTAPYKYLNYNNIPTGTSIYFRLDITRSYDSTNHVALLNLKAYIGDTFGSPITDGDICSDNTEFQDITSDLSGLCPLRSVTLQQDSIPISAIAQFSNATASCPFPASSSNLVTVTTAAAHNLANGATVTISGVNPSAYNGTYPIAVLDSTHFTYTLSSCPAGYVSGGDVESMASVYFGFTNARSGTSSSEDQSITIDQLLLRSQ